MTHDKNECGLSNEYLGAFVDNQLDEEEKKRLALMISGDESLKERVRELQALREMVRDAYRNPPPAFSASLAAPRRRFGARRLNYAAAVLALAAGFVIGWAAKGIYGPPEMTARLQGGSETVYLAGSGTARENYIVHISSSDPVKLKEALDRAESLLKEKSGAGAPFQMEILANSGGLDLLRSDVSPFAERISRMQNEYGNVKFLACARGIDILKYKKGIEARLLPRVTVASSALDQIMKRIEQGWVYIKI